MTRPLLYCLPTTDRISEVAQKLDEWQRRYHNRRFILPPDSFEQKTWYDAPDYEELEEIKLKAELKRAPKRSRYHKI